MSMKLLYALNGSNNGPYRKWLDDKIFEPRIAWYPSAGQDFRDLLYLSPAFAKSNPISIKEPATPDIFLHTDYFPWSTSSFLDTMDIHVDSRTSITVRTIEELPRCDLHVDRFIVDFPRGSSATGKVLFLEIDVSSDILGNFSVPLLYVFSENAAFFSKTIEPNQGIFSHIIHVRYGGGCGGGGKSSGSWLLNILKNTNCEVFITDNHLQRQSGDDRVFNLFGNIFEDEATRRLETIRTIKSESWSNHGEISWNLVK